MLPRANGTGAADANELMTAQGADAIGNEAIFAPVATADNVARPGGGSADYRILGTRSTHSGLAEHVPRILLREKRFQISAEDQFRTPFGGAVGIIAAHRVVFPVSPDPFLVFIAFVGGDVDQDFDADGFTDGLKHVDRAADVGVEGQLRFVVGEAYDGLGRQVKDKFRLIFAESFEEMIKIADISMDVCDFLLEFSCFEVIGIAGRIKGITDNFPTKFLQPDGQPRTLKAGVAGD